MPPGMSRDVLLKILSEFEPKGLEQAKAGVESLGKLSGVKGVGGLLSVFRGLVGQAFRLANPLNMLGGIVGKLTGAFGNLGGVMRMAFGVAMGQAIGTVSQSLAQMIAQPTRIAAEVEKLEETLSVMATNAGYSVDFVREKVETLKHTGITTRQSIASISQFLTNNLPIENIEKLARAGQDMAVVFGRNSSEVFQRFTYAILSGNTELLRAIGINIYASEIADKYAKSIGKTADALTASERQQAMMNAILEKAAPYAGAYEKAMGSVGKQLGSLPRYIEEAQLAIGRGFIPLLSTAVLILTDVLKSIKKLFDKIGPSIRKFTEGIKSAVMGGWGKFKEFFGGIVSTIQSGWTQAQPYLDQLRSVLGFKLPQILDALKRLLSTLGTAIGGVIQRVKEAATGFGMMMQAQSGLPSLAETWQRFLELVRVGLSNVLLVINAVIHALQGDFPAATANLQQVMENALAMIIIIWEDWVSRALTWGYNLIASYAQGIINGVADAIQAAMNYVGQTISNFLASFSPPKEGPLKDIIIWAQNLMETYLRGFSLADYSILERSLQPIERYLRGLAQMHEIPIEKLPGKIAETRAQVAALIDEFRRTGQIPTESLRKFAEALGEGGDELAKLLELQMKFTQAQDKLKAVQDEVAEAEAKGFVPAELKKKLSLAQKEADAAGEQLALQEKFLQQRQAGLDLQLELLHTLEGIEKALKKISKTPLKIDLELPEEVKARPAIKPEVTGTEEMGSLLSISSTLSERFEEARQKAREMIAEWKAALQSLPTTLAERLTNWLDDLKRKIPYLDQLEAAGDRLTLVFNTLVEGAKGFVSNLHVESLRSWDNALRDLLKLLGYLALLLAGTLLAALNAIGAALPGLGEALGGLVQYLGGLVAVMVGGFVGALEILYKVLTGDLEGAKARAHQLWDELWQGLSDMLEGASRVVLGLIEALCGTLLGLLEGLWIAITGSGGVITKLRRDIETTFMQLKTIVLTIIEQVIQGIIGFFENLYHDLVGGSIIPDLVDDMLAIFAGLGDKLEKIFAELVGRMKDWGANLINNLIEGIKSRLGPLADVLGQVADRFPHSPAKTGPLSVPIRWESLAPDPLIASIRTSVPRLEAAMSRFHASLTPAMPALAPAVAGAGGSSTVIYIQNPVFPGVRDGRDARDFLTEIQASVDVATARAAVPGGIA